MPPQASRLSRKEFNQVFRLGRRSNLLVATLIINPSPSPKLSVVVGKKVARLAHTRNRIRRQAYHQLFPTLKAKKLAVIVLLKSGAKALNKQDFKVGLDELGRRIVNSQ